MNPPHILIADDQRDVLEALHLLFKGEGFQTRQVTSPAQVLEAIEEREFDLVLIDLNYTRDTTSGKEGIGLLGRLRAADPDLPVVVMTAWGSVDLAVEAMRVGAKDFVQKPWDNARLLATVRTHLQLAGVLKHSRRVEAENQMLRGSSATRLVGSSRPMQQVADLIQRIGPSDANVLITGENGTGKGVVARALHECSRRSASAFVIVNTGGINEGVFESEMFGHVRGAFTDAKVERMGRFEMALGGTLFLDEIANVPASQQPKLLRVLETGEFERVGSSRTMKTDARILSATNADIAKEVEQGRFRQDLLFRLNTVEIHLPPLRERREDIPLLAGHFLGEQNSRYRKELDGFDEGAIQALTGHDWPGNVRELSHVVERAVLMSTGKRVTVQDLGLHLRPGKPQASLDELTLDEVEKQLIKKALARFDGKAHLAAEALGLSRSAFYRRLEKYEL